MKKQVYYSPEVGVAPLFLSACIMSGKGTGEVDPGAPNPDEFGAPRRRVF